MHFTFVSRRCVILRVMFKRRPRPNHARVVRSVFPSRRSRATTVFYVLRRGPDGAKLESSTRMHARRRGDVCAPKQGDGTGTGTRRISLVRLSLLFRGTVVVNLTDVAFSFRSTPRWHNAVASGGRAVRKVRRENHCLTQRKRTAGSRRADGRILGA